MNQGPHGGLVEKVCPVVLQTFAGQPSILAFRHPLAGVQLAKGTLEDSEDVVAGALRELHEESGITSTSGTMLGSSSAIDDGQFWHFVRVDCDDQPERWSFFTADEGGLLFEFFWWRLADAPGDDWHYASANALAFVRGIVP